MKKNRKILPAVIAAAGLCSLLLAGQAFAGDWHKDGNVWRYTDDSGRGVNQGWVQDNGSWYFFQPDATGSGALQTGWVQDNGTWYYLNPSSGDLVTGWQPVNGLWYYFDPSEGGAMAVNRVVDGYYINASGVWADGSKGVSVSAGKASSGSRTTASSSASSSRTLRRYYDEDDDEYYYYYDDDDEDDDDDDDSRSSRWDDSYSDDGPGFYMSDLTGTYSGPGINITVSDASDYPGAAQKTTDSSWSIQVPGTNSYVRIDGSFFDDDEAGGSKEDWLNYAASLYGSQEKDAGDYTGDYGVKYDYSSYTFTDDDGNRRTIINKERNERE